MPKRRDAGTVLRRDPAPRQSQAETRAAAQGASGTTPDRKAVPAQITFEPSQPAPAEQGARPQPTRQAPAAGRPAERPAPAEPVQPQRQPRPVQFDDDELDVPDFLK